MKKTNTVVNSLDKTQSPLSIQEGKEHLESDGDLNKVRTSNIYSYGYLLM